MASGAASGAASASLRKVLGTAKGSAHGPITRLVSPSTPTGELLKPFIFLDFVNHPSLPKGFGFGMHPHSGIATVTYQLNQDVEYVDTEGRHGVLKRRGVEWMRAGGGAWHRASFPQGGPAMGFQLWIPLPPDMEDGPSDSVYYPPEEIPIVDGVSVLVGEYGGAKSPLQAPYPMNYWDVELRPAERKRLELPADHDVAFAFVYDGAGAAVNGGADSFRELVMFDKAGAAVELEARAKPARVLVGTAAHFAFGVVAGGGSVHTNAASYRRAQARIQELGAKLEAEGKMF